MTPTPRPDPVLRTARREAAIVSGVWLTAMIYTVGYCYLYGYGREAEDLQFVLGFPDWVFWGIITPWLCCWAFGIWFAYGYMTDIEFGPEAADEPENHQREQDA